MNAHIKSPKLKISSQANDMAWVKKTKKQKHNTYQQDCSKHVIISQQPSLGSFYILKELLIGTNTSSCYVGKREMCVQVNSIENKDLYILYCQVEVAPVTQSYQSFMMIYIFSCLLKKFLRRVIKLKDVTGIVNRKNIFQPVCC